jgi:hypothetical protein
MRHEVKYSISIMPNIINNIIEINITVFSDIPGGGVNTSIRVNCPSLPDGEEETCKSLIILSGHFRRMGD